MAQGIYPEVHPQGMESSGGGTSECKYQGESPSEHVEEVEAEFAPVAHVSGGSTRASAESVADHPAEYGDAAARFSLLSGPGQEAVFIYATPEAGGSDQTVDWLHGSVFVSLEAMSLGASGYTADLSAKLKRAAQSIDTDLGS
jgi:hypothetical protein